MQEMHVELRRLRKIKRNGSEWQNEEIRKMIQKKRDHTEISHWKLFRKLIFWWEFKGIRKGK